MKIKIPNLKYDILLAYIMELIVKNSRSEIIWRLGRCQVNCVISVDISWYPAYCPIYGAWGAEGWGEREIYRSNKPYSGFRRKTFLIAVRLTIGMTGWMGPSYNKQTCLLGVVNAKRVTISLSKSHTLASPPIFIVNF